MISRDKEHINQILSYYEGSIIYIKNLPFKSSSEDLFDLFSQYGPVK